MTSPDINAAILPALAGPLERDLVGIPLLDGIRRRQTEAVENEQRSQSNQKLSA